MLLAVLWKLYAVLAMKWRLAVWKTRAFTPGLFSQPLLIIDFYWVLAVCLALPKHLRFVNCPEVGIIAAFIKR